MAKLGVSKLRNPLTIVTKFGMGDYVVYMIPHAKIQISEILLARGF